MFYFLSDEAGAPGPVMPFNYHSCRVQLCVASWKMDIGDGHGHDRIRHSKRKPKNQATNVIENPKNQATKVISGNSSKFPLVCYLLTVVIKYVDSIHPNEVVEIGEPTSEPLGNLREKKKQEIRAPLLGPFFEGQCDNGC